jgi:predicted transcriptional regulator
MKVKDFFEKDINRNIETVIKADDRDNISTEVAEYVITDEIGKKIRELFQSYNDYSGANGVWISGFFGSGKSHLLKILSYVLENKEFDGYKCGELFAEKIENDEMLKGDVLSATRTPSESILFNIDQQAQITSKTDANAILSVFYKVFYDHLGYYGFQPHVAEFEMWLDKNEKYQIFKSKFSEKHNNDWEKARVDYFDPAVTKSIAEVLGEIFSANSSEYANVLDTIEDKHKQSIEDFCQRVNDYLTMKPKGFRLNFFVDEVGQYISDNTKLMLNLQTIAETLATTTKGNSWILVTSQEDMEKVVGDMNKSQQNDFARIQARFKLRITLTSSNVDEVIEKRLLKKTKDSQAKLIEIYKSESSLMETLLGFSDSGIQFKGFKSQVDFSNKMPFVAYQFDLFQQCRIQLSTHNAFQGKHASVGERSMLGVFQHVTRKLEDKGEKTLVSFDLMFDGIRNELKSQIQTSIQLAEGNLENEFAIRVLKALFLVKYFRNFKTTKRNISVLMIESIDVDLKQHEKKIDEALNLLEIQSYVQRNGELYEFLTDDEKDVEEEIKNTDVDEQAVTNLLKELFFDEVIRENKIKYVENRQDYEFSSKVDGILLGREKELEIEIITENYFDYGNIALIQAQSMGNSGIKFILPQNATFIRDLKMYLKTDKYNKQNQSTSNRVEVKRILQEKGVQNAERRRTLVMQANKALASSEVYLNGENIQFGQSADGKTLVINAFQSLVKTVFVNLRMLGSTQFSEDTFKQTIMGRMDGLFGNDDSTISEAESEILTIINRRKGQSDRTSLNDLKTNLAKKPYGWYPNAVWTILAKLYKRGKIEIKKDSNILDDMDVIQAFLNSANYSNVLVETQAVIDPKLVKELKQVYAEAFDENCSFSDAKDVANAFKDKLKKMHLEVSEIVAKKAELPFVDCLVEFKEKIDKWLKRDYDYFLLNLHEFEDYLIDTKETKLDPIKRFVNGEQLGIYESIKSFVNGDLSNLDFVEGNEIQVMKDLLENEAPFNGNVIREAKTALDDLSDKIKDKIQEERKLAIQKVEDKIALIKYKEEFIKLEKLSQNQIITPFTDEIEKLKSQRYIGNMRNIASTIVEDMYSNQLNAIGELLAKQDSTTGEVQEPAFKYIRSTDVKTTFTKSELQTEEDVNEYIEKLKLAMLEKVRDNKRITL